MHCTINFFTTLKVFMFEFVVPAQQVAHVEATCCVSIYVDHAFYTFVVLLKFTSTPQSKERASKVLPAVPNQSPSPAELADVSCCCMAHNLQSGGGR